MTAAPAPRPRADGSAATYSTRVAPAAWWAAATETGSPSTYPSHTRVVPSRRPGCSTLPGLAAGHRVAGDQHPLGPASSRRRGPRRRGRLRGRGRGGGRGSAPSAAGGRAAPARAERGPGPSHGLSRKYGVVGGMRSAISATSEAASDSATGWVRITGFVRSPVSPTQAPDHRSVRREGRPSAEATASGQDACTRTARRLNVSSGGASGSHPLVRCSPSSGSSDSLMIPSWPSPGARIARPQWPSPAAQS